ncbi:XrtA system polysaccharide deacetylase [Photobacterium nomapromontoriensis]|uniref:XrtA system polysaccharide deacetylase n=1 Tax=Photobacterium nomapromontoriensis TaxID=2910237 RepID=UPI003D0DA896
MNILSDIPDNRITNAMTIDLEDYFHAAALSSVITPNDWGNKYPVRVEACTHRILQLLDNNDVKATFFVLGWVAQACPKLIELIAAEGHEIASHGFAHLHVNQHSQAKFYADLARSKHTIESLINKPIYGYRAPSFSIDHSTPWAFEVLQKLGFTYSSSTYPIKHDLYGVPDWPRFKYQRPEGIIEVPIPTLTKFGRNIPIGGGGYFRFYPYRLSHYLIRSFHQQTGQPYSFYFHPWEIDPAQPHVNDISLKSQFRHYLNLSRMEQRLNRLLIDFKWDTMKTVYQLHRLEHNAKPLYTEISPKRTPTMG